MIDREIYRQTDKRGTQKEYISLYGLKNTWTYFDINKITNLLNIYFLPLDLT